MIYGENMSYKSAFITVLAVGLTTLLMPGSALALVLADIKTHSTLNQPLHASIPITATKAELSFLQVGLASNKVFLRTGIERKRILNSLIVELVKTGPSAYIKVTSKKLIREPLLEFVLFIDSDSGRIFRRYSIFLSPR